MEREFKALLFLVCVLTTNGMSLRRRSVQNPYDLSRALEVLDRERRRIEGQEYLQELLNNQDSVYPYDDDGGYMAYRDTYSSPGRYTIADILDAYPGLSLSDTQDVMPSEKRSLHSRMTEPSIEELKAIFGPSNSISERSKKRDISVSNRNLQRDTSVSNRNLQLSRTTGTSSDPEKEVKSTKNDKTKQKNDKQSRQISELEMEKLLSEAEKVDKDTLQKNKEEKEKKSSNPVSKEELESLFTEKDSDNSETEKTDSETSLDTSDKITEPENSDSKNNVDTKTKNTENSPAGDNQFDYDRFWKLNKYVNLASGNKKKRVTKRDFTDKGETQKTMIKLATEVEALRDEVSRLKLVEFLEDKENDFLAGALKDATLAQLQGSDQYLKGEYGDIQNAIEVEEILQLVKPGENSDENEEEEAETATESEELPEVVAPVEDFDEAESDGEKDLSVPSYRAVRTEEDAEKRSDSDTGIEPSVEDKMGRWYEMPLKRHTMTPDEAGSVLQNLIQNYGHETDADTEGDEPIIAFEPPNDDIDSVVDVPSSQPKQLLQYDLASNTEDTQEYCPAVQNLHDNCVIADAIGLPIDDDARGLCSRHQTCYTCGSTVGFTLSECDGGFRGDILALCGKDSKCRENGAKFLSFIKGYHRYNFDYAEQCDVACVKDYIIGL